MLVYFRIKSYKEWLPLKQRKDSKWGRHKVWRNCTYSSVQNYSVDVVQCNAVKKSKVFVHFCRFQFKAFFFLFLEKLMRKNPPTTCAWLEGREKRFFKVQVLWEGHKIKKKFPTLFWNYLVTPKQTGIFLNFLWPSQNIWTLDHWRRRRKNNF